MTRPHLLRSFCIRIRPLSVRVVLPPGERPGGTAARRRTTLKNLVVQGLKHMIHAPYDASSAPSMAPADDAFFETDAYGVPVLKRRGATVTNAWIEKMREEEGI